MLLPFYFKRVSKNRYLVSNLLRQFQFVDRAQFDKLCAGSFDRELKNFFAAESELDSIAEEYRRLNAGLFYGATLHIFVLTLACNLNCLYCQAEYARGGKPFMSAETARRAVEVALSSPEDELHFEFQGGEPLLNFDALKTIVECANELRGDKVVKFSLVTNAQAMTDEILSYLAAHDVQITFSIDGPKFIHDANRPTKDGSSNFDRVFHWFKRARDVYAEKNFIRALPTTTRLSLSHAKEIVDFYCALDVADISLRELSPFGRVGKNFDAIGYTPQEFLKFYRKCMDYIIALNLSGKTNLTESLSKMILQKIFGRHVVNYPDLRSPCGATIGQIAYNWNGDIYTCDEGRMLANRGIENFRVGNVRENSYRECLLSAAACEVCNASCVESNPSCESCVYNSICGLCPVYSFFTQGDFVGVPIRQARCKILRGIYDYLIEWSNCEDTARKNLCERWGTEP